MNAVTYNISLICMQTVECNSWFLCFLADFRRNMFNIRGATQKSRLIIKKYIHFCHFYCHFQSGHLLHLFSISNDLTIVERSAGSRLKLEHLAIPLVFIPRNQNGVLSAGVSFFGNKNSRTVQGLASREDT